MVEQSELKSFEGISNVKIVDGKKVFNCTQCGKCCYFREEKNISNEEEQKYYQYMFAKFGIIYLAPLSKITINLWPEEAEVLQEVARQRNVDIKILPKRAILDAKKKELIVLDYFIDSDVCPFFDKKTHACGVYNERPIICRAFPLTSTKSSGNCEYKLQDFSEYDSEMDEAKKLELLINRQKSIIEDLINSKKIEIPNSIDESMLEQALLTFNMKELRIMHDVLKEK